MKRYFIRSLKYFVAIGVLCTLMLAAVSVYGPAGYTWKMALNEIFTSERYLRLFISLFVLALCYPRFGYTTRRVEGDMTEHRDKIVAAFESNGFYLVAENEDEMRFRATGWLQRTMMLFEDEIRVTQYGQWICLEGIRRGIARVEYRLDAALDAARRGLTEE